MCQYGGSCKRKGCVYRHPAKAPAAAKAAPKSKIICVHFVSGRCTFGDKCANRHPGKQEVAEFREQCGRVECRFGAACENADCLYSHDGGGFFGRITAKYDVEPTPEVVLDLWWQRDLSEEVCDPISLEPIREMTYPPFGLGGHWFDGAVLATYAVSTSTFANPMTREPMTRQDCRALDEYLVENRLFVSNEPRVTEAFDLLNSRDTANDSALRREATSLLHSLFGFERYEGTTVTYQQNVRPLAESSHNQTLADAWNANEDDDFYDDDDDDDARGLAAAAAEHALGEDDDELDDSSFPALAVNDIEARQPPLPNSFAAVAAAPPLRSEAKPTENAQRSRRCRDVKMPQELWVPVRDARVFEVRDPIERYYCVAARQRSAEVVDLHFQSSRTVGTVLDKVLEATIAAHGRAWIVTGSGHHAPTNSHQKKNGVLFDHVQKYLETSGFDFSIAKDSRGHAGSFLVYGPHFQVPGFFRTAENAAPKTGLSLDYS